MLLTEIHCQRRCDCDDERNNEECDLLYDPGR